MSEADMLRQALALHQAGRLGDAEALYRRILSATPQQADALHYLGVLRAQCGDMAQAADLIGAALKIASGSPFAHFHLAEALAPLERKSEALVHYDRAIALKPDFAEAHNARAGILLETGRHREALEAAERAVALQPANPMAQDNRGHALAALGDKEAALAAFDRAIALKPDLAEAHNNRGIVLLELGRSEEALAAFDRAIALKPDFVEAHVNRGSALLDLGPTEEALASLQQALALKPDYAETYYNLGNVLSALGNANAARAAYDSALTLKPDHAKALYNRASLLESIGLAEEALADSDRALALDPALGLAASRSFFGRAQLCDWQDRAARIDDLARRCRQGQRIGLFVNSAFDDPELLLLAARGAAGTAERSISRGPDITHARLRVAYLSPDFHDHPVAHQAVALFEHHDRTRFETFGICLRSGPDSAIRRRLKRAFDHFIEAGGRSDRAIAQLLADSDIDIAVDLAGHTDGGRTKALSFRPAPVAVNFLGYPGTLGADYVDYIIADAHVVPEDAERFYAEKIVRLPDCFLPSGEAGHGDTAPVLRSGAGLPEQGFVFCAFGNAYKITPEIFAVWMRLLQAVEGSVLWLSIGNAVARRNLCAEAEARGVSPRRLVFAERVATRDEHLARLALADLCLDTLPYNAHSTASDMLWAGVPLVTCMGRSFAARVAGSLLHAAGLEALVTHDLGAYEETALALARAPERLSALRGKLAGARGGPLFDTARQCRQLEAAYGIMLDRHRKGLKPQSFSVKLTG